MSLISGFVAFAVIAGVGYMILVRMMKNNPKIEEHIKGLFNLSRTSPIQPPKEQIIQTYDDKRTLM